MKALLKFIVDKLRSLFKLKNEIENKALESGESPKEFVKDRYEDSKML